MGTHIARRGADPENELGGGQFRRSGGRKGSEGQSPPEADDFSQATN